MNSKRIASALIVLCLFIAVGLWWAKLRPAEQAAVVQEAAPPLRTAEPVAEVESPVPVAAPTETVAPPAVNPAVLQAVVAAVDALQHEAAQQSNVLTLIISPREVVMLWSSYDANRNGVLESVELQELQAKEPDKATEAMNWDLDGDGKINNEEASQWMKSLPSGR